MKTSTSYSSAGTTLILSVLVAIALCRVGYSQELRFEDYEFSQFITSQGGSPSSVVNLDNNWAILIACRRSTTEDDLKSAGLAFSESQLVLLNSYRLLQRDDKKWRTAFPILDSSSATAIRQACRKASGAIADTLSSAVEGYVGTLGRAGRANSAFTILFSYVMDDLVWGIWEDSGALEKREVGPDKPFWAGEVWAVYPPREFSCGTNSVSQDGVSLKVNWSEPLIRKMLPFVTDWKNFGRMFDDLRTHHRVMSDTAFEVFKPFNLFDEDGEFTIPEITARSGDPLYDQSLAIADDLARLTVTTLDIPGMTRVHGFRDDQQTLVVVYHELMWELLDEFCRRGAVHKPAAFADPAKAESSDIGDLVFVVRN